MVGEESALMRASVAVEIKGFQHLSVECLRNNPTHPACFCYCAPVIQWHSFLHWKKGTKNVEKIASLPKMEQICCAHGLCCSLKHSWSRFYRCEMRTCGIWRPNMYWEYWSTVIVICSRNIEPLSDVEGTMMWCSLWVFVWYVCSHFNIKPIWVFYPKVIKTSLWGCLQNYKNISSSSIIVL